MAAQGQAQRRAARPRAAKLAGNAELRQWVQDKLEERWSPGQISVMLEREFADRLEMRVSAIGTLVERSTRFVLLLHLPDGYAAEQVAGAMTAAVSGLPAAACSAGWRAYARPVCG